MPSRLPLIALLSLLALACTPGGGDDDDSDGGPGGGGSGGTPPRGTAIDVDELSTGYGAFVCEYLRECSDGEFGFNLVRLLVDAGGNCERYFADVYRTQIADGQTLDELRYDAAAFTRCRTQALGACVFADRIPACEAAVRGRRAVGEPCAGSTLCAPGLHCAYDPEAQGECREVCAARSAPGETCEYDEQCAHDGDRVGFCRRADPLADEGICATYALRGGAAVGQPCGLVTEGDAYARVNCREDAYCDATEDDAVGTCQTIPGPGQPCVDTEFPCRDGICLNQICVALQVVNAAGSPCDLRQFQICNPIRGLVCLDGTCVASQGGAGQPCTAEDFGGVGCQDGLYCNDDSLCAAALADGEACDPDGSDDACQSGDCVFDPETGDGTCGADVDPCL